MRLTQHGTVAVVGLLACTSCSTGWTPCSDTLLADQSSKVTITTGIWGVVSTSKGVTSTSDSGACSGTLGPLQAEVGIFSPVATDATRFQGLPGTLIASTSSDAEGFYQLQLPPGTYSVLVKDSQGWFTDLTQGSVGNAGSTAFVDLQEVSSGSVTEDDVEDEGVATSP